MDNYSVILFNTRLQAATYLIYKIDYNIIFGGSPVINDKEGFLLFVQTSLGKILMITIDQIIHLIFLFPLVWMALN